MVLLSLFYRDARAPTGIDAVHQAATDVLSHSEYSHRPYAASNIRTSPIDVDAATNPLPQPRPTISRADTSSSVSSLPSLSRKTSALSGSRAQNRNTGVCSDGSLFTFTDAERAAAQAQLDALSSSSSSSYSYVHSYTSAVTSAVLGTAALKTGSGSGLRGFRSNSSSSSRSSTSSVRTLSPDMRESRARGPSAWTSGAASVTSVTNRGGARGRSSPAIHDDW